MELYFDIVLTTCAKVRVCSGCLVYWWKQHNPWLPTLQAPQGLKLELCSLMSFSTSKGAEEKNASHGNIPRYPQCVLIGLSLANTVDSNKNNKIWRTIIIWNLALVCKNKLHIYSTLPWMYMTHSDLCNSIILHRSTVEKR